MMVGAGMAAVLGLFGMPVAIAACIPSYYAIKLRAAHRERMAEQGAPQLRGRVPELEVRQKVA